MGLLSRRQALVGLSTAGMATLLANGGAATRILKAGPSAGMGSTPFISGEGGYSCYRTPALAISSLGTVLAFSGGRVDNCEDDSEHDIVLRRSLDGGQAWEPLQVIASDGRNRCDIPVPIVLSNGRILLLWLWNAYVESKQDRGDRRVKICHSDDHGESWSRVRDITEQVRRPGWKSWYGIGPGHGFVMQRGPAAGRVVVPARHGEIKLGSRSHLIFSDNDGMSWQVGAQAMGPAHSSEATACERADGSVMLNSRGDLGYRIVTISTDGGISANETYVDRALIEPGGGCQASLLTYELENKYGYSSLLFSNPAHPQFRTNGRLRISLDGGQNWTRGFSYQQSANAFTGYSDLAKFVNGDIGLLFESGASYIKGVFANDPEQKLATKKDKRAGKADNRHDKIAFRRMPFPLILQSS